MKILRNLLLGLVGLIVLLAGVGLFLPDTAHVERSTRIQAAPERVHAVINDYARFNEWSPWAELDPKAVYEHSGPSAGVGAKMSWHSEDSNVGSGSQEIIESRPDLIRTALDFGPDGKAVAFFKLEPAEGATQLTWGFDTQFEGNIVGRYFGLLLDGMVGADYEKGLAKLKALLEKPAS
ncbi:MAG: SRPBCC family protein [Gammaproteobacteria bacterium]|nr:SRPBCC family protein [Gammaproteobacteria bacterium]